MQKALPPIMEQLELTDEVLARKSGIAKERIRNAKKAADMEKFLKWSEYLTLLFIFWTSERGRSLVEKEGLFPKELKDALSVNRNVHLPV